jgi:hypothetical protein
MPRDDIRTGEKFSFQGFWWIPSDDGPAHRAQGKLTYEPSNGIKVEAVNVYGGPENALNGPERIPVLYGETVEGKPCTLFDVICKESHGTLFGGHSEELLTSNFLVHGAHSGSSEEIVASRMRVGLHGLGSWLIAPWPGRQAALKEDGTLEIPLAGARLIFQEESRKSSDRFSEVRTRVFNALFEFDKPTALADLNEKYVRPLHDLLILGTNEETRVTERTILIEEEHEKWWDDKKPLRETRPIAVVQRGELIWHADKKNAFHRIPLPLGGLGEDPVAGVQRWYALRAELAGAGNSLFATINRRFRALEVDLLSLLSVAEGYHRARFDSPVISEAEHKQAVEDMIDALPEHLQANYRKRLAYANEQTQRQRLKELFGNVEAVLPKTEGWSKLVNGLVQTRNFLTHWGDKGNDVMETPDLIEALTKLEVVLRVNLMIDLGLNPTDIQTSVDMSHGQHSALDD